MPRKSQISLHEAIVIALINSPLRTASFEEIAKYIESRNLYPDRKGNITLKKQVMLRSTKSKGRYTELFEEIGAGYIRLKDTHADFSLSLWFALESLLEHDQEFYNPQKKSLSVVDRNYGAKETKKIHLSPSDIICIQSENKSRRKKIYFQETVTELINCVYFNSNDFNFEKLCKYLDPLSHYLVVVSKSAIINVGFFDLVKKQILKYNGPKGDHTVPDQLNMSTGKGAESYLNNFNVIKEAYKRRILLQKAVIGYKNDLGL
jgi:hypothetical protein